MVASSSGATVGTSASAPPNRGASASSIGSSTGSDTVRIVQPPASSRFARGSSAMISAGSVRPRACRISSACHQPLIRVATPPALSTAIQETIQAGQLRIAIATRSPLAMPAPASARARRVGMGVELGEGQPLVAGDDRLAGGIERAEGVEQHRQGRRQVGDDRTAFGIAADLDPAAFPDHLLPAPRRICGRARSAFLLLGFAFCLPLTMKARALRGKP